jgi:hypothetical protein
MYPRSECGCRNKTPDCPFADARAIGGYQQMLSRIAPNIRVRLVGYSMAIGKHSRHTNGALKEPTSGRLGSQWVEASSIL